jgi:hypothetical protein
MKKIITVALTLFSISWTSFAQAAKNPQTTYPVVLSETSFTATENDTVIEWKIQTVQVSATKVILEYVQASRMLLAAYKTASNDPRPLKTPTEYLSYVPVVIQSKTMF